MLQNYYFFVGLYKTRIDMGCWNDIVSGTRYSFKALGDLFFPRKCAVCQTILACEERNICDDCRNDIPYTWFWSWPENPAEERMWSKVGIESAASLFFYRYTGGYGNILHKFKYRCNIPLGLAIGQDLGKKWQMEVALKILMP